MPSKKYTDLGIVLVNWNCKQVILHCLESIKMAGYIESVIIVDNASDDGSIEEIKSQIAKVKIIESKTNLGFAEGNNRGIKYLLENGARYIFILNPDTEITKDTIPELIEVMEKDKRIGIVGPKILIPTPRESHPGFSTPGESEQIPPPARSPYGHLSGVLPIIWSCGGIIDKNRFSGGLIGNREIDKGQYDKVKEVDFISGTAMMVRSEVFEKVGLLENPYFMYYEDVEFCQKAKKAGFKIIFVPSTTVLHKESSSIGKNSPAQEYYMARNHLLFVERYAPISIKIREFIRLPKTVFEHWLKGEKWAIWGIGDYFIRKFGRRDFY